MLNERTVDYLRDSLIENHAKPALTDYKGESFTYGQVAEQILDFHLLFESAGIRQGDKIALLGKNSARWCITYLSVITYGGVIVPILPDFKQEDLYSIINHSDAVLLFCADNIYEDLDIRKTPMIKAVISLQTFHPLLSAGDNVTAALESHTVRFNEKYPEDAIAAGHFSFPPVSNNQLAVLSYTSGTSGNSKGVMLSHNNLSANIRYARNNMPLKAGDSIVSFLPLAHTYGCAFEFLFPFSIGCHITILTRTPSPQIITQAFQEIRPALILSVPLVIEKIYKKQILPVITKPFTKILLQIPGIRKILFNKIRDKLTRSFGGNFREVIIGGAPFNRETELFFRKIRFPYTVGYGMTECGPLISYAPSAVIRSGSAGRLVDTLEIRIDSPDPQRVAGEIMLSGENITMGYYKNEETTRKKIDSEGWLHTGDSGTLDAAGFIYIKGRCDSMIPDPSGKNIYPEELEALLNNKFAVGESLVVYRADKLIALIHPDADAVKSRKIQEDELQLLYRQYLDEINASVPSYMNITRFEIHTEEFIKTPKQSIKRYLYS